jgi:hypothetical protein
MSTKQRDGMSSRRDQPTRICAKADHRHPKHFPTDVAVVDARTCAALQGAIAEHVRLEHEAVLPQDSDRT